MMGRITQWLMRTSIWEWSLKAMNSLEVKISGGKPKFPMSEYHRIAKDILVSEDCTIYTFATAEVSSPISMAIRKLTDGDFNHAGFLLADESGKHQAFHVTTEGLVIQDLLEVLRDADYICINKLKLEPENFAKALGRIEYIKSIGHFLSYDYAIHLENGDDKFYCSEATFYILDGLYDDMDLQPQIIYGLEVFSPSRVTQLGDVVYTNHPSLKGIVND